LRGHNLCKSSVANGSCNCARCAHVGDVFIRLPYTLDVPLYLLFACSQGVTGNRCLLVPGDSAFVRSSCAPTYSETCLSSLAQVSGVSQKCVQLTYSNRLWSVKSLSVCGDLLNIWSPRMIRLFLPNEPLTVFMAPRLYVSRHSNTFWCGLPGHRETIQKYGSPHNLVTQTQ